MLNVHYQNNDEAIDSNAAQSPHSGTPYWAEIFIIPVNPKLTSQSAKKSHPSQQAQHHKACRSQVLSSEGGLEVDSVTAFSPEFSRETLSRDLTLGTAEHVLVRIMYAVSTTLFARQSTVLIKGPHIADVRAPTENRRISTREYIPLAHVNRCKICL